MADKRRRWPQNVAGAFYVDEECIDCNLCSEIAPDNFRVNLEGGHDYVYKQPAAPQEEGLCREAMQCCPVDAIGDDGDAAAAEG